MNKLRITRIAPTNDVSGKIEFKSIPLDFYKTLDELGDVLKKEIDIYINHLKNQCEGHDCTHATVIYPLIHVIFDDMNKGNKEYQEKLQIEQN